MNNEKMREEFEGISCEAMMNHVRWSEDRGEYVPIDVRFGFAATEVNSLWDKFQQGYEAGRASQSAEENQIMLRAEDADCVDLWLNDQGAPKHTNGNKLSLVGRIMGMLASQSEWVSVSDMLPEKDRLVAVLMERDECVVVNTCKFFGEFPFVRMNWESGESESAVTHWVYIPEPPKGN